MILVAGWKSEPTVEHEVTMGHDKMHQEVSRGAPFALVVPHELHVVLCELPVVPFALQSVDS